jgi:hypothetical protein
MGNHGGSSIMPGSFFDSRGGSILPGAEAEPPEKIVQRNLWPLVAAYIPDLPDALLHLRDRTWAP